jgi:hypothetical protein
VQIPVALAGSEQDEGLRDVVDDRHDDDDRSTMRAQQRPGFGAVDGAAKVRDAGSASGLEDRGEKPRPRGLIEPEARNVGRRGARQRLQPESRGDEGGNCRGQHRQWC